MNALLNKFHAVEFFSRVNEDAGRARQRPRCATAHPGATRRPPRAAVHKAVVGGVERAALEGLAE